MNIVPVAPIGLPSKAGYSFTAVAASLKKISTGPLVTEANTNGDCVRHGHASLEAERVHVEREAPLDVGDQEIGRELLEMRHWHTFRVCSLMPTSTNSARTRTQVGVSISTSTVKAQTLRVET